MKKQQNKKNNNPTDLSQLLFNLKLGKSSFSKRKENKVKPKNKVVPNFNVTPNIAKENTSPKPNNTKNKVKDFLQEATDIIQDGFKDIKDQKDRNWYMEAISNYLSKRLEIVKKPAKKY